MNNTSIHELHKKYGLAKDYYNDNEPIREALESEWRDCSMLTLPHIFPPSDTEDQATPLPSPYNSIGPAAVNALASKLLLALIPPTGVFFRLIPDKEQVKDVDKEQMKKLENELAKVEKDVVEYINQKSMRVPIYEAIKLLIITGNAMIYKVPNGSYKVFSPYQYVTVRDYVGNVLTSCIKETVSILSLPKKIQEDIKDVGPDNEVVHVGSSDKKQVDIYTMIIRVTDNKYQVWQEINGTIIDGTDKTYTSESLPYTVLRWSTTNNEDYGRGIVSQYLGDLRSLEGLSQTILEGSGISAMHLFGLRPGSTLKVEDLNNASNGQFVMGDLEREVSVLQVNKAADLQVPFNMMQSLEQRLSKAFLMLSGQVRDSERTTATEVRATASELESTLGGVFSVLAAEFQKPLVTLILKELQPEVLKFTVPSITTGISAISREKDYNNLNTMLQAIAQLGPEVISQYLNIPAYLSQVATALGMDPASIVKTQDQIQMEQQQQMQQQQQLQQQQVKGQMDIDNNRAQTQQKGEQ